jgi:prefoldin subunit 5
VQVEELQAEVETLRRHNSELQAAKQAAEEEAAQKLTQYAGRKSTEDVAVVKRELEEQIQQLGRNIEALKASHC